MKINCPVDDDYVGGNYAAAINFEAIAEIYRKTNTDISLFLDFEMFGELIMIVQLMIAIQ